MDAIERRDIREVKRLVESGFNVTQHHIEKAIEISETKILVFLLGVVERTLDYREYGDTCDEVCSKAVELQNIKIVKFLIDKGFEMCYPEAKIACQTGNFEIFKILIKNNDTLISTEVASECARYDRLVFFLYLQKKGLRVDNHFFCTAAKKSSVNFMKKAIEFYPKKLKNDALCYAVQGRSIEVLRLLLFDNDLLPRQDCFISAISKRRVDFLKILLEKVIPEYDVQIIEAIEESGDIEIAKLFVGKVFQAKQFDGVKSIKHGNYDLFVFLVENGLKPCEILLYKAIEYFRIDFVRFIVSKGCAFGEIYSYVISNGRMDVLPLLISSGCHPSQDEISCSVKSNHMECLKYLVSVGFYPEENCCIEAIKYDRYEILKYLLSILTVITEKSFFEASKVSSLKYMSLLFDFGWKMDYTSYLFPIKSGDTEKIKFLLSCNCQYNEEVMNHIEKFASAEVAQIFEDHMKEKELTVKKRCVEKQ